ncbi:MaoC family dehydratase [Arundinibacter roseus]|uniref:MaoC family dehydratase n=1 Tax=Arundinibacter roseus TaxID=2070510 RepID=A0A4R4KKZ5_9BACT|nr:MaoC family dehydratase [Arundinibacter roseus]TDB68987.1 MaoC family dehydratase [Arundinibacter roseus]
MKTFETLAEFCEQVGQEIGVSAWETISQAQINAFADATGDHQWIHIDPDKAATDSPFKTTIAHGFLTLSLAPKLMAEVYEIRSVKMGVNYGANKVRFTSPVPAGSRVRMRMTLLSTEPQAPNGIRATAACVFELEAHEKPACVAELVTLLFE